MKLVHKGSTTFHLWMSLVSLWEKRRSTPSLILRFQISWSKHNTEAIYTSHTHTYGFFAQRGIDTIELPLRGIWLRTLYYFVCQSQAQTHLQHWQRHLSHAQLKSAVWVTDDRVSSPGCAVAACSYLLPSAMACASPISIKLELPNTGELSSESSACRPGQFTCDSH